MQITFILVSFIWVFIAYKLRQKNTITRRGLIINYLLLTIAWAGLNVLLGLILLFDFIESVDQNLIAGFMRDKVSLGWILFCFANGLLNMIFGAFLISGQIKKI